MGSGEYTDYKGKTADPRKHGGIRAASFACGKPNFINLKIKLNYNFDISFYLICEIYLFILNLNSFDLLFIYFLN